MPRSKHQPSPDQAGKATITIVETRTLLGKQRWHTLIQAKNHRILFRTEKYWNRVDAEGAAAILKDKAKYIPYVITAPGIIRQRYRAVISAFNNRTIFYSETYHNEADAEHALDLLNDISDLTPVRYVKR